MNGPKLQLTSAQRSVILPDHGDSSAECPAPEKLSLKSGHNTKAVINQLMQLLAGDVQCNAAH